MSAEEHLYRTIAEYLESKGWTVLVMSGMRVEQRVEEHRYNFDFCVRFTGSMKSSGAPSELCNILRSMNTKTASEQTKRSKPSMGKSTETKAARPAAKPAAKAAAATPKAATPKARLTRPELRARKEAEEAAASKASVRAAKVSKAGGR